MPLVPITMRLGKEATIPFFALLDSGADKIIFADGFAAGLGIQDVTIGERETTIGVGSQVIEVFFHDGISIQVIGDDRKLPCRVGFVKTTPDQKKVPPLLGRVFFAHFKSVSFDENNEMIELKPI